MTHGTGSEGLAGRLAGSLPGTVAPAAIASAESGSWDPGSDSESGVLWGGAASSRRGGVTGAVARAAATALAAALRLAAESGSRSEPGPESESLCWHDHGHGQSQSHRDGAAHLPHRPAPGPGGRCSMLALLNASGRLAVWNLTWSRTGNLNFRLLLSHVQLLNPARTCVQ